MSTVIKNPQANELLAKADQLGAEIADLSKDLTMDEVQKKVEGAKALRARARAIVDLTPEKEMERRAKEQDEADGVKVDAPEKADDVDEVSVKSEMEGYCKDFAREFRSLAGFARAGRFNRLTERQRKVLERGNRIMRLTRATDDPIIGDTGDPSGGEFLLPLQQVPSIFRVPNVLGGVLPIAQKYNAIGRTLRIPYVVQDSSAGGITRPLAGIANWTIVGEGDEKPQQDPKFNQRLLTIYKAAAISKIGDETMADDLTGGQLPPTVIQQVGQQGLNFFNELMTFTGSGTSEPLGALHANNNALIVVNRTTTQQIKTADVFAMLERFTGGVGEGKVWLHSRRALAQILGLSLAGTTLVTFLSNLNDSPSGRMLLGYPLIMSDILPALGVQGDLALVDGAFYAAAIRQQLTVQSSIHVEFVNDLTTWRFITRMGGIPIPTDTYAYAADGGGNKINEFSPFVVLGDATTS